MRRLTVVLLAAGLIVWLAAPALSSRPFVPRAVEFEQGLATRAWVRGADGRWRSPVVVAPKRFDLVGLHWSGRQPRRPRRSACAMRQGGRWGRWTAMAADHGGGTGAEPVWAGGADAYQLRLDRRPRGLRARFVNATGSATAADRRADRDPARGARGVRGARRQRGAGPDPERRAHGWQPPGAADHPARGVGR